ncbi:hypothetical protein MMPV_000399 [Pyropia vietnamensis]
MATFADAAVKPTAQATAAMTPSVGADGAHSQRSVYRSRGDSAAMTMVMSHDAADDLMAEATAADVPAAAPDGRDDANDGATPPLPASLWEWLAPHRVPRTDPAYAAFRPFIAVTRHILGAELVDLYGVFLTAFPVMTTYVGLLGPSLGPTIGGAVPAVDAGMLPYTSSLRRAAMASASAKSGCGYCTAHTVGVGGLLSGTYRGERKGGGEAPTLTLRPPPCNAVGGSSGDRGGTAEAAVIAYAAAAAAWPPLLTSGLAAAAAAALDNNAMAFGALQSSVAYTGFLNTTMALLEPPLELPLASWVTAVVAASPDLTGHPVEAKAAAAAKAAKAAAAQAAVVNSATVNAASAGGAAARAAAAKVAATRAVSATAVATRAATARATATAVPTPSKAYSTPAVGLLTAPPDMMAAAAPRGVWTKALDLLRLLPAIARLPSATERLVLGNMPRDAGGVTVTVRSALGGHLPSVLVKGVLPTDELRRAVAAAYVDHFGPCASGEGGVFGGGGGGEGGGGGGDDGRPHQHWSQEERIGLLARFAATAGDKALAAEAAALGARLGGPAASARAAARAAAAPRAADVAARIVDAAATRRPGGLTPDMAAVVSSGLPASAVVEVIGLAGFIGYLQRLWVVFLGAR